jgi:outer membrane protein OmpA-like peptidoglycan-associated protein
VGRRSYNLDLSRNRARSVVEYLVSKGVAAERISYQGFGPDQPIADNKSPLGRAKNRRVEITILEME